MPKRQKMTVDELRAIVGGEATRAVGRFDSDLGKARDELWRRYFGEPYGEDRNEPASVSKVIDRSVAEQVDWLLPELARIFVSSDEIARLDATSEEDEEQARDETEALNKIFFADNRGYIVILMWLLDGLVSKNAYVKAWWETREVTRLERHEGLDPASADAFIDLEITDLERGGAKVEIESRSALQQWVRNPETGEQELEEVSQDVTLRVTETVEGPRVAHLPPDEFIISPRWNSVDLEGCPFCGHASTVPASDLIERGFDRDQVDELPEGRTDLTGERETRFNSGGLVDSGFEDNFLAPGMRMIEVTEAYIRADWDGDGIAELLKVTIAGRDGQILKWADHMKGKVESLSWPYDIQPCAEIPIFAWTPWIIPGRHVGTSVAERVTDIQRIRSVIWRQGLTNLYLGNNLRPVVSVDQLSRDTIPDILNPRPGHPIRVTGPVGTAVSQLPVQSLLADTMQMLQYAGDQAQARTGITRFNQGLETDVLKRQSGVAVELTQSAGRGIQELIARNFAETGLTRLMLYLHKLVRQQHKGEMSLKIRGEWRQLKPSRWPVRTDMTVHVGLGTGSQSKRIENLMTILQIQQTAMTAASPLVSWAQIYNTLDHITEAMGYRDANQFFADPKAAPPQPAGGEGEAQQGDPAQALVAGEQIKAQAQLQIAAAKTQADLAKEQLKDDRERDIAIMNVALELMKLGMQREQAEQQAATIANQNQPGAQPKSAAPAAAQSGQQAAA